MIGGWLGTHWHSIPAGKYVKQRWGRVTQVPSSKDTIHFEGKELIELQANKVCYWEFSGMIHSLPHPGFNQPGQGLNKREWYFLLSKNASHYFQTNYRLVLLSLFHVTAIDLLAISSPVFIRRGDRRSGWDLLAQKAGSCSATIRKGGWASGSTGLAW